MGLLFNFKYKHLSKQKKHAHTPRPLVESETCCSQFPTTFSTLYEIWHQQNGDSLLKKTPSSTNCKSSHFQRAKENFCPSSHLNWVSTCITPYLNRGKSIPNVLIDTVGHFLGSREKERFPEKVLYLWLPQDISPLSWKQTRMPKRSIIVKLVSADAKGKSPCSLLCVKVQFSKTWLHLNWDFNARTALRAVNCLSSALASPCVNYSELAGHFHGWPFQMSAAAVGRAGGAEKRSSAQERKCGEKKGGDTQR